MPDHLVRLWRTAFGGRLDYDLPVRFEDHVASLSFSELFFPGSSHYRDLWGWIEAQCEFEMDAAEEAGEDHDGKLRFLPIGGFEYLDRVFVDVTGGAHHGSVVSREFMKTSTRWPASSLRLPTDRPPPACRRPRSAPPAATVTTAPYPNAFTGAQCVARARTDTTSRSGQRTALKRPPKTQPVSTQIVSPRHRAVVQGVWP